MKSATQLYKEWQYAATFLYSLFRWRVSNVFKGRSIRSGIFARVGGKGYRSIHKMFIFDMAFIDRSVECNERSLLTTCTRITVSFLLKEQGN